MMFRPTFRQGFNSTSHFMNTGPRTGFGFGLTGYVGILALIITVVGVVWLGLTMTKMLSGNRAD
jgi:hypothetical protein